MKRVSQILVTAAILLAPWAVSGTAFAASTCQVGYTGPDSNNQCVSTKTFTCNVDNNNNLATVTYNNQTAYSGISLTQDNTQGGSSSSGSATDTNGVTYNVTVNNGESSNQTCVVAATVPATPIAATATTPTGGVGAVTAPKTVAATALPNTSSNLTSEYLVTLASALGIGAIASYLVATVYSRRQ
ncbi:MAG TPA: hypothetical protein VMR16_02175 [Candidatus Saccharimonadales bacterium]|nr:hypothetical protein [Candidatus Saccharimonadales bacterium]